MPATTKQPLRLLPQPVDLQITAGRFSLKRQSVGVYVAPVLSSEVAHLSPTFPHSHECSKEDASILVLEDRRLSKEAYRLHISPKGITMWAATACGMYYAIQTLRQIILISGTHLPCLSIKDAPALKNRGAYLDITRGRVPTLETLKNTIRRLSEFKINHVQLYIEHVFQFDSHPDIGQSASPLSGDDIKDLDAFCKKHHVELVPSIASFGHMANVLKHPAYHHLAEDLGKGIYEEKEYHLDKRYRGWTLSPAIKESYRFIEELYEDILPHFSSPTVNVCCDEVYDLGKGQSRGLCQRKGKSRVFTDHVLKLRKIAKKFDRRIQFWSDCIREDPEELDRLPDDVTLLDWGYEHFVDFDRLHTFQKRKLTHWACPGTSSWVSLFPRLHEARANIDGYVEAAQRHGTAGLLCTDWGDGGHHNFRELSWHGFVYSAARSWNPSASTRSFTRAFTHLILGADHKEAAGALDALGQISHLECGGRYQSIWFHLFFAKANDPLWQLNKQLAWVAERGRIRKKTIHLNADYGEHTLEQLQDINRAFSHARRTTPDNDGLLPYWQFAVHTQQHAASSLKTLGDGGKNSSRNRKKLADGMSHLLNDYETLWKARNRISELRITRTKYRQVIKSLESR